MRPSRLPLCAAMVGTMFGAGVRCTSGDPAEKGGVRPREPNVVVLYSEKRITLSGPSVRLPVLANELGKQTGRKFILAQPYRDDIRPFAVLLHGTPLHRVLDATAYVTGGKWERKGTSYTLRVPDAHEIATDSTRYGAALQDLAGYLASVDVSDPALPPTIAQCIERFRRDMDKSMTKSGWVSPYPEDSMRGWSVSAGRRGLGLSWMATTQDGSTQSGQWEQRSWGWEDAKH